MIIMAVNVTLSRISRLRIAVGNGLPRWPYVSWYHTDRPQSDSWIPEDPWWARFLLLLCTILVPWPVLYNRTWAAFFAITAIATLSAIFYHSGIAAAAP
jgi:hypothetical protein